MTGDSGGIGIYFLGEEVTASPPSVFPPDLLSYARTLPGVSVVRMLKGEAAPDTLAQEIKGDNISRVLVCGTMPGATKSAVSFAMVSAGREPDQVQMVDFSQHGAAHDVDRCKALLACAFYGVPFETAAVAGESEVHKDTLVIGGGIAGIQASLEIANAGHKVFLVEKTGTIGGHMAMFDKTFPTLDCAACILTPKMVEVGQSDNIELITYAGVTAVNGEPGNYKVRILKKARKVNITTCIGCGTCSDKCPGTAPGEFDSATAMRKAIYIPFPQAVPNKYLVDEDNCLYCTSGGEKCGVCKKVCPVPDCIDLDQKDEEIEITVGNIIAATGFTPFDAKKMDRYGYGKFPNVVTSLEFERLVNAAGPTGGNIRNRGKDKKGNAVFSIDNSEPKRLALIHCIGSRDENHHKYCSRVCCMYSLKLAHLVKEKLPDAEVTQYYIDMRAFGKGYEEFYDRIKDEGVRLIRGRTAKVDATENGLLLRSEDIAQDRLIEQEVDMVILAVGLEPREDAATLAQMLGIPTDAEGWFREADPLTGSVDTCKGGISIAGVCQGPKDIPDTVAQASAAAARVLKSIIKGKVSKNPSDIPFETILNRAKKLTGHTGGDA
ncbi:MAG: CoB--CoM heterodisulfide reductase iron-sulfur subunit A family protein [bacterium]|nr:CoB--CoM heterodisulfide reductase iron-sulfur subunit A family protein [bacterium]